MPSYLIQQPGEGPRFGDLLKDLLEDRAGVFNRFEAAIAFAKRSGIRHLHQQLRTFLARGGSVRIVIGIDHGITSVEGLQLLLKIVGARGEIWVFHNENPAATFHPKIYIFEGTGRAILAVGSNNLTEGGLFTNYESAIVHELNLNNTEDLQLLQGAKRHIDRLCDPNSGLALRLDAEVVEQLRQQGLVGSEGRTAEEQPPEETAEDREAAAAIRRTLFRQVAVPPPPALAPERVTPAPIPIVQPVLRGFVMTLHRTDVGVGQVTRGTQRRSPEIFIPLAARDAAPQFWGWPNSFVEDRARRGKYDRVAVVVRIGGADIEVNMMTWPVKHDFRIRSEALRSAGDIGDILRIERANEGDPFDYRVEILAQGTRTHAHFRALCTNATRNSDKRWGYY